METVFAASKVDILQCQFEKWYAFFIAHTMKSHVIHVSKEFLLYLGEDGMILPESTSNFFCGDQLSDDEEIVSSHEEDSQPVAHCSYDFSSLEDEIQMVIRRFKGEVFPKFTWSAPSDASWMTGGSMKCRNLADIYLLLKASDRVTYDVEKMFEYCTDDNVKPDVQHTLVIRKWANMNPAMEFRAFVRGKRLIGISQRDCSTYYKFLAADSESICDRLEALFNEVVRDNFPLDSYTFDAYLDRDARAWVVDFNPFGLPTSALLFEWSELFPAPATADTDDIAVQITTGGLQTVSNDVVEVELRLVESEEEVHPSAAGAYRGPIDVHLSHEFPNFMEICKADQKAYGEY